MKRLADAFNPLGFKKKGTVWTKNLLDGGYIEFNAQKSMYADVFYFNVSAPSNQGRGLERVIWYGTDSINWQLLSEEQIDALIERTVNQYIEPYLN